MFDEKTWGKEEFDRAIGHYGMINEPVDEEPNVEELKRKANDEHNCGADKK